MYIHIPESTKENASEFMQGLEDDLIELDVPVWKVAVAGIVLIGIFVGSFILYFKLFL